jgi:hypothetical protein
VSEAQFAYVAACCRAPGRQGVARHAGAWSAEVDRSLSPAPRGGGGLGRHTGVTAHVTCIVAGVGWLAVTGDASLMDGMIVRGVQRDFHRPMPPARVLGGPMTRSAAQCAATTDQNLTTTGAMTPRPMGSATEQDIGFLCQGDLMALCDEDAAQALCLSLKGRYQLGHPYALS